MLLLTETFNIKLHTFHEFVLSRTVVLLHVQALVLVVRVVDLLVFDHLAAILPQLIAFVGTRTVEQHLSAWGEGAMVEFG